MVTTLSELSGTSKQYDNFSSLSDSALTVRVQQPSSKAVRRSQVYISGSACKSLINRQEVSTSGSLTLVNALEETVTPSSHTRVPGNVSTAYSSQQLGTSGKVSRAPSCGQIVGSISGGRDRKCLGTVQTADNVGTHMDFVSSSVLPVTSSKLSGTSSQYKIFSSLLNYALGIMVQQGTSNTVSQPQDHISDSVYRPSTVQEEGSTAQSLTLVKGVEKQVLLCSPLLQKMFNDRLKPGEKSHLQKENPQHQSSQQG
jgi:hypothetical protein